MGNNTPQQHTNEKDSKRVRVLRVIAGLMPFWFLYAISDVAFVILYHLVRYRRRIVRRNLATSFPEKTKLERLKLERRFYRWLCDYFVETFKLLNISDKELRKRLKIVGAEEVEKCFQEGQDCSAFLGHYCNWEWLSCTGIAFPENRKMGLIYKPLRSEWADKLFQKIRTSQPSSIVIPKNEILRHIVTLRRQNIRSFCGYIADQGPRYANIHLWLDFLNHDTGVFTGAERIMRKMNNAVFYIDLERPKRGYYTATLHLITRNPAEWKEHELTRRFFHLLEQTIRREPAYYLWTHNRWKRSHEQFDKEYVIVDGKTMPRKQ